jgi:hypothetical protein
MKLIHALTGLSLVALAAGACTNGNYFYRPAENSTAQVRGRPAADYDIPSAAHPQGNVRIASFGIAKITPKKQQVTQFFRALHVRMVVSNGSSEVWTVNTQDQLADVRNLGKLRVGYAESDANDLPNVTIQPGGKRTIDLFFPLPHPTDKASRIPEFDVLWRVQAGARAFTSRAPFERLQLTPYYAGPWYPYTFGPFGWYDPIWGPGMIAAPGWYW